MDVDNFTFSIYLESYYHASESEHFASIYRNWFFFSTLYMGYHRPALVLSNPNLPCGAYIRSISLLSSKWDVSLPEEHFGLLFLDSDDSGPDPEKPSASP